MQVPLLPSTVEGGTESKRTEPEIMGKMFAWAGIVL